MTLKMCKHATYACEHDKQGTCTWALPGITADCKHDDLSQIVAKRNSDAVGAATALDTQIGGTHYKDFEIQPAEFITKNRIGFLEGNAIKYLVRHKLKGGAEDIRKAIHYCELILELEYHEKN